MDSLWKDLEVVITGGTGALGSSVVERLVDLGARCRIPCFDEKELEQFTLRDHPSVDVLTGVDLSDESEVDRLFAAYDGNRPLWASIHLVGGFHWGRIEDTGGSIFDRMIALNARTCYLCCRRAVEALRAGSVGGRIVNVAARPALTPAAGGKMVAYTGSKAAVAAMTVALAEELADEGIWVNAVAPSILNTAANREDMPDADHATWPTPEDVARTITFLASPENATTRGAVVPVFGRA